MLAVALLKLCSSSLARIPPPPPSFHRENWDRTLVRVYLHFDPVAVQVGRSSPLTRRHRLALPIDRHLCQDRKALRCHARVDEIDVYKTWHGKLSSSSHQVVNSEQTIAVWNRVNSLLDTACQDPLFPRSCQPGLSNRIVVLDIVLVHSKSGSGCSMSGRCRGKNWPSSRWKSLEAYGV